jgi:hypothetical protein
MVTAMYMVGFQQVVQHIILPIQIILLVVHILLLMMMVEEMASFFVVLVLLQELHIIYMLLHTARQLIHPVSLLLYR